MNATVGFDRRQVGVPHACRTAHDLLVGFAPPAGESSTARMVRLLAGNPAAKKNCLLPVACCLSPVDWGARPSTCPSPVASVASCRFDRSRARRAVFPFAFAFAFATRKRRCLPDQPATGDRQPATGKLSGVRPNQQATGNRQQATGNVSAPSRRGRFWIGRGPCVCPNSGARNVLVQPEKVLGRSTAWPAKHSGTRWGRVARVWRFGGRS
jgi:hypothetical protein